jgi:hypothetical protein
MLTTSLQTRSTVVAPIPAQPVAVLMGSRAGRNHPGNVFDAYRFQLWRLLAGEMLFNPLQDESDLRLSVTRTVKTVFDEPS